MYVADGIISAICYAGIDIISNLLQVKLRKRFTVDKCIMHAFLQVHNSCLLAFFAASALYIAMAEDLFRSVGYTYYLYFLHLVHLFNLRVICSLISVHQFSF